MDLSQVKGADALLYGGGLTGFLLMCLSIFRAIGVRASKDALSFKEDGAHRDTITMLQKRIDLMDQRITILEISRNKLFAFSMSALSFINQCACAKDPVKQSSKEKLDEEFQKILLEEQHYINLQTQQSKP